MKNFKILTALSLAVILGLGFLYACGKENVIISTYIPGIIGGVLAGPIVKWLTKWYQSTKWYQKKKGKETLSVKK